MNEGPAQLPTSADIERRFKVCEGCDRVLMVSAAFDDCPACHSMRFDNSIDRINAALHFWNELGERRHRTPRDIALMIWEDFNCHCRKGRCE